MKQLNNDNKKINLVEMGIFKDSTIEFIRNNESNLKNIVDNLLSITTQKFHTLRNNEVLKHKVLYNPKKNKSDVVYLDIKDMLPYNSKEYEKYKYNTKLNIFPILTRILEKYKVIKDYEYEVYASYSEIMIKRVGIFEIDKEIEHYRVNCNINDFFEYIVEKNMSTEDFLTYFCNSERKRIENNKKITFISRRFDINGIKSVYIGSFKKEIRSICYNDINMNQIIAVDNYKDAYVDSIEIEKDNYEIILKENEMTVYDLENYEIVYKIMYSHGHFEFDFYNHDVIYKYRDKKLNIKINNNNKEYINLTIRAEDNTIIHELVDRFTSLYEIFMDCIMKPDSFRLFRL